jgi:hypothetical protein
MNAQLKTSWSAVDTVHLVITGVCATSLSFFLCMLATFPITAWFSPLISKCIGTLIGALGMAAIAYFNFWSGPDAIKGRNVGWVFATIFGAIAVISFL